MGTRLATALQQEPMKTFLSPEQMATLLRETGWQVIESCDAAFQNERYLAGRKDGLKVPEFAHVVHAARMNNLLKDHS